MNFPNDFYPDLTEPGDLAARLRNGLGKFDLEIQIKTFAEEVASHDELKHSSGVVLIHSRAYAHIEHDHRTACLYCEVERRMFSSSFTEFGIEAAKTCTPDLDAIASMMRRWVIDRVSPETLSREFSSVELIDRKSACEEVDARWDVYHKHLAEGHPELFDFYQAAKSNSKLQQLFPFTSMWSFCFSRCTHYPFTRNCPNVRPKMNFKTREVVPGYYEVFLRERYLGEGPAVFAIQIVVQYLPRDCGPAVSCTADYFDYTSEPH